jgi:hypothetical protein
MAFPTWSGSRNNKSNFLGFLQKSPKAVLALVELLFSFVLEAIRSLFQQWVAAASSWSVVFDPAATMPSEFTQVFSLPKATLPT